MKRLALITAAIAIASPAMAQNWTSYQMGDRMSHTGYDQGRMWTGESHPMGSNQTNSTFYGPNGQMTLCRSVQMGDRVNTTCN